jgi:precorrin-2 dehydrogenase/sirohydrochlorin ferrochelatase
MRYYPVFLDLRQKNCLVVGGGQVGERKVKTLQACGARVRLVSRDLTPYLSREIREKRVSFVSGSYQAGLLEGCFLVIGATDDPQVNRRISSDARQRGLLCNIADSPEECNFILPSLLERGDLLIAVSTSGQSPALAKKIRRQLEREFPPVYETYLKLLGRIRLHVLAQGRPQEENRRLFETLVDSQLLPWLEAGEVEHIYFFLENLLRPPIPRPELAEILPRQPESLREEPWP